LDALSLAITEKVQVYNLVLNVEYERKRDRRRLRSASGKRKVASEASATPRAPRELQKQKDFPELSWLALKINS